jgi:hypothetical protein
MEHKVWYNFGIVSSRAQTVLASGINACTISILFEKSIARSSWLLLTRFKASANSFGRAGLEELNKELKSGRYRRYGRMMTDVIRWSHSS